MHTLQPQVRADDHPSRTLLEPRELRQGSLSARAAAAYAATRCWPRARSRNDRVGALLDPRPGRGLTLLQLPNMSGPGSDSGENPLATSRDEHEKAFASPWSSKEDIKKAKLSEAQASEYLLCVQNKLGGAGHGKHTTSTMHSAATTIQKHARGQLARGMVLLQREAQHVRELAHLKEFSLREILTLGASCMAPLLDAASDFSVMAVWAESGQEYQSLLLASIMIHVCAGTASGIVFTVSSAVLLLFHLRLRDGL